MKSKQLYQDKKGNCVFVGYDEKGIAKFGSVRGTLTEKKYRGDCKNSDKRYAFKQVGTDTTKLYIFEAPIDLMSYYTLHRSCCNAVALCGLYDGALRTYLRNNPQIKRIVLCLDMDQPGQETAEQLRKKYAPCDR